MEIFLLDYLSLDRCPHCSIDQPGLVRVFQSETRDAINQLQRAWGVYSCLRCGGLVTAAGIPSGKQGGLVTEIYPKPRERVDSSIPERAREYLKQAQDSLAAPAGAVMLTASALDAMLKAKNYRTGSLYSRIVQAAEDHLITDGMAEWAHQIRLDANEQRHSDDETEPPDQTDARRSIEFALALAQFLFVLPAQVERGIKDTQTTKPAK